MGTDGQRLVGVADDDPLFCATVRTWVEREGHRARVYPTPEALRAGTVADELDLLLLDVVFGAEDGREICLRLRREPATKVLPVILVSAHRKDVADMVDGLERGADDYLLKPLDRDLAIAKMNAAIQRFCVPPGPKETIERFGMRLDLVGRRAHVGKREIQLTRMEFNLLSYLLSNPGRVLTPTRLLEAVWGYEAESYDDPATVQVHISRLRRKLGEAFSSRLKTLISAGYRLD